MIPLHDIISIACILQPDVQINCPVNKAGLKVAVYFGSTSSDAIRRSLFAPHETLRLREIHPEVAVLSG